MYGFHKQKHTESENYFQHETFRRGDNMSQIKRKPERKKKCTQEKIASPQKGFILENLHALDQNNNFSQNNQQENLKDSIQVQSPKDQAHLRQEFKEDQQNSEEVSSNSNYDQNIAQICQQAIIQNQILRKSDKILKDQCLQLKKLRLSRLRNEQMQEQQCEESQKSRQMLIEEEQMQNRLNSAWQIIKAQTLKLNLQLEMYLG